MKRELTCIICPAGCALVAEIENKSVINVSGNICPRGKVYAENECINPKRVVSSTVRCEDGGVVSVKTSDAISKDKVTECMKIINNTVCLLPVSIGDVIIDNMFGSKIIATSNRK